MGICGLVLSSASFPLSLAVVVGLVYIGVLRLVDLNENEPLWGLGLALITGVFGALVLSLLVDDSVLELTLFQGVIAKELAIFVAAAVAFGLFQAIGRVRGWSEVNGVLDGVVYGAAVGLGYGTGEAFLRELAFNGVALLREPGEFSILWKTLLAGLAYGVFGALIGLGFGAAVDSTSSRRAAYPLLGLVGAYLVHVGYVQLATGDALGTQGEIRALVALAFPAVLVLALIVGARTYEANVLREQLVPELEDGNVTAGELAILRNPLRRRRLYAARCLAGDFDGWLALRTLHNRLVQLALVKARAERERDPERRARLERELANLRVAVADARAQTVARVEAPSDSIVGFR